MTIQLADGTFHHPMPFMGLGGGVQTPYGTLLPPGTNVACFLRSSGAQDGDSVEIQNNLVTTLASALARVRANRGDTIYVLPGHSESVSDATMLDGLEEGTKIIGIGTGSDQPVFRWTATSSQWTLDKANVTLANLYLRLEGANGVVKAINCTAADNTIVGCRIQTASGASNKATIAIEVGTGAHRFKMLGCKVYGTATHNSTDCIKVVAAVTDIEIGNCDMIASVTAANGLIHVTAAALNVYFHDLDLYNTHTSSTATIAFDDVACDGVCKRVYSAMKNDGTATAQGITFGTAALVQCNQCFTVDAGQANGILSPAVET